MKQVSEKKKLPFYKRKGFKTNVFLVTLLAYPVLQYLVFWVYTAVSSIQMSFYYPIGGEMEFVGFLNYELQWKDVIMGENVIMNNALKNSFKVLIANAITLPLAIITAYAFYKKIYCEKFFRVVFYLPTMISTTVLTMAYYFMWVNSPETNIIGPVAQIFNSMGLNIAWWDVMKASNVIWPLILGYSIWAGLGTNVILICGAMLRIPKEVVESGYLDGLGFWRELVTISIPLVAPTISTFVMTSVMGIFTYYMAPMLLAGYGFTVSEGGLNGQAYTIGWAIFNITKSGRYDQLVSGTALGTMFSLFALPVIILLKFVTDKLTPDVSF